MPTLPPPFLTYLWKLARDGWWFSDIMGLRGLYGSSVGDAGETWSFGCRPDGGIQVTNCHYQLHREEQWDEREEKRGKGRKIRKEGGKDEGETRKEGGEGEGMRRREGERGREEDEEGGREGGRGEEERRRGRRKRGEGIGRREGEEKKGGKR
jgi:hypothetical protein